MHRLIEYRHRVKSHVSLLYYEQLKSLHVNLTSNQFDRVARKYELNLSFVVFHILLKNTFSEFPFHNPSPSYLKIGWMT